MMRIRDQHRAAAAELLQQSSCCIAHRSEHPVDMFGVNGRFTNTAKPCVQHLRTEPSDTRIRT